MVWQWLSTGFGEANPTTGATGYAQDGTASGRSFGEQVRFDLRYPGQVWDEETGLSYNLHRYYDTGTGRYVQADPIGLEGGWNRFGYVDADPLNARDPDGLHPLLMGMANAAVRAYGAAQGALYRYAPALTEFIAGASGVNGTVVAPMSPLVAQIPTAVSRMTPVAQGIAQGMESGAYCVARSTEEIAVQFGRVENQISHTFRHVEKAGFNRGIVQEAIKRDLTAIKNFASGQYSGKVVVNGTVLEYSAFKLSDGVINVGRITPPR